MRFYDAGQARAIAVVTEEEPGVCELKNLATREQDQGKGYGRAMVEHLFSHYTGGTGKCWWVPVTALSPCRFYEKCGFVYSTPSERFFTRHYDHPIFEAGKQLTDMVYFIKEL